MQQALINAYSALTGGRPPEVLRPWLYRVAHNAALNIARDPQAGLDRLPEGLDGVERPDEVVQRRERLGRVVSAVNALPDKQRQVIVRHALEGDSHERIASDLGMSAGAIRQLAHRARATVRAAAASLFPAPLMRLLEATPAVKATAAVVVAGAAGGGAIELARQDRTPPPRADLIAEATPPPKARAVAPKKQQRARPAATRTATPAPPRPRRATATATPTATPQHSTPSSGQRRAATVPTTTPTPAPTRTATPQPTPIPTPEATVAPAATPERIDNSGPGSVNSGQGSDNSGHGSGGDDVEDNSGPGGGGSSGPG